MEFSALVHCSSYCMSKTTLCHWNPSREVHLIVQSIVSSLEPSLHCTVRADVSCNANPPPTSSWQLTPLPALTGQVTCLLVGFLEESSLLAKAMRVLDWDASRIDMLVDDGSCWLSREESWQAEDTWHVFNNPWGVRNPAVKLPLILGWCDMEQPSKKPKEFLH